MLKVGTVFSNERWIIDIAGCQYGFSEILVPFDKYVQERDCRLLNEPVTYDWTETHDLDYFATLPFMNKTRAQRESRVRERQARLQFASFVAEHDFAHFLDGTKAAFCARPEGMIDGLGASLAGRPVAGP